MRWRRMLTVVGAHAEGEIGNVVIGGVVNVPGNSMFDKKRYLEHEADEIRRLLLLEPRGAPYNNTNIILASNHSEADFGFVIMSTTEYSAMSGSNAICVATVALEMGIVPMSEPETQLTMESPAGLIHVKCRCENGKVTEVEFTNIPCFVLHADKRVEVRGVGTVRVDVAYGGIIYALADANDIGFSITPDEALDMCSIGQKIKAACNEQLESAHPKNPEIRDITNVVLAGEVKRREGFLEAKSGTVVLHGRLDRSPCGTGTSARLAVLHAKGLIGLNEIFINRSITGTQFKARIVNTTKVSGLPAIVPAISGQAWITGVMQFGVDPTDPFQNGHFLSDVWSALES